MEHYGDTVFIYEPGYVVKIGQRLMSLEGAEAELHAYKVLYTHCDSLRQAQDSSNMQEDTAFLKCETALKDKAITNEILRRLIDTKNKDNLELSNMYTTEKRKSRRQKYIYGFSGGTAGFIGGILLTVILLK